MQSFSVIIFLNVKSNKLTIVQSQTLRKFRVIILILESTSHKRLYKKKVR